MKRNKILLIVEGEKAERELFTQFYDLYGMNNVEIVAYKTHIYAFYNRLKKEYSNEKGLIDFETVDLPLFLNDYLNLPEEALLDEADFSDIILVFDFDPHDSQYDEQVLFQLIENYSESTGKGKLYINYPMLESYKDITSLDDPTFHTSQITLDILKMRTGKVNHYKKSVDAKTCIKQVEDIDVKIGNRLIELHLKKLGYVLGKPEEIEKTYRRLCEIQCENLAAEGLIWVLNTSILHMYEQYGYIDET